MTGRRALALSTLVLASLAVVVAALWFRASYVGWFGEHVSDVHAWQSRWQSWLDRQADVRHPALVHLMPPGCPCRFFAAGHAAQISRQAAGLGYGVYQTGRTFLSPDLARPLPPVSTVTSPGPLVILSGPDGRLRYLGPYSDGLRCTRGSSLVDDWLALSRPGRAVTLDVTSCRCRW